MKKSFFVLLVLAVANINAQWIQMPGTDGVEFKSIETQGNLIVAGSGGRQVFISTDNGTTWRESKTGIENVVYVNAIAITGTGIYIGTDIGVFYTADSGLTWSPRNSGLTDLSVAKIAVSGINIFAAGNSGIFYSSNGGSGWAQANSGINNVTLKDVSIIGNYVYAGGGGGVYISSNNGSNWTQTNTGLPSIATIKYFTQMNNNVYAGTHGYGIFSSPIGGTTWTAANSSNISNAYIEKLITVGTNIFASTWGQGIFVTADGGLNWNLANTNYPNLFSAEIAANTTHIFAVGSTDFKGVWRRPLNEMVVTAEKNNYEIPTSFILEQNYPNPFNPATVIKYQLPEASFVRLTVYDNLGREAAILMKGYSSAGYYKVTWEPNNLASGIYFIALNAGQQLLIKKAIFLK